MGVLKNLGIAPRVTQSDLIDDQDKLPGFNTQRRPLRKNVLADRVLRNGQHNVGCDQWVELEKMKKPTATNELEVGKERKLTNVTSLGSLSYYTQIVGCNTINLSKELVITTMYN